MSISNNNDLLQQHRQLIIDSSISSDVAKTRGYRSVEIKAELKRFGFRESQCRVPGLLIPIWSVTGEIVNYQLRPDHPRIKSKTGGPIKYETVANSRMALDVPPIICSSLGDPAKPLFITEGVRKADAAASRGLCCIDVLGVWNWRGTNELGGKTVLADWEFLALNGREVHIVFDNDAMTKPEVHAALTRLQSFLTLRGANVSFAYLPPGKGGEKVGLDDFFAAGSDVAALMSLMSPELRDIRASEGNTQGPYVISNGRMYYRKRNSDGDVLVPLCNFEARIVSEVVRDDGAEPKLYLEVEGEIGASPLPRTIVPATEFASMNWVLPGWGVTAVVSAGMGAKDRLREAIQVHSSKAERRRIYTHVGWCKINGDWVYLHAGGAIGKNGNASGVSVEPEGALKNISFPDPPEGEELRGAIRASLSLLDLGPDRITVPSLGAVYRAPLNEVLTADFSLHYSGPTGVFKSEKAALDQGHYGVFTREELPGSWISTANSLERQAFLAKDAIFVADDFAPSGTQSDVARHHKEADRLFRGAGNHSGRGRLRSDGSARAPYVPRGIVISTGEDIPRGQSTRSRVMILEVSPGDIDLDQLTTAQQARDQGLFTKAMAGYLQWLAPQIDKLRPNLRNLKQELRTGAMDEQLHRRIPDTVVSLAIGLKMFLDFAQEVGAVSKEEVETLWKRICAALGEAAAAQTQYQASEEPAGRFLALVAASISSGKAHVADADSGKKPADAERWGWKEFISSSGSDFRQQGTLIGWLSSENLYLEPESSFAVAQQLAHAQGSSLPITQRTLWKRLNERGLLTSYETNKNLARITILGERRHVVHLLSTELLEYCSKNRGSGGNGATSSNHAA